MGNELENLEAQKQDFTNLYIEINSTIQDEESRQKLWEISDIINDIERQIESLK